MMIGGSRGTISFWPRRNGVPHAMDRFANHENTQLPRFNSRFWCPGTEAVDAFSVSWAGENN